MERKSQELKSTLTSQLFETVDNYEFLLNVENLMQRVLQLSLKGLPYFPILVMLLAILIPGSSEGRCFLCLNTP